MPLLLADRAALNPPVDLFTAAEGRALGMRLHTSEFVRIRSGVYARREAYEALPAWDRYATRVHAFVRSRPDAILSHESAAVLHGLPLFGETRHIHVYDPESVTTHVRGDVRRHASVQPRECGVIGAIRVTSVLDTVVDMVRALPLAQGLAVADAALSTVQGGGAHTAEEFRIRSAQRADIRGAARSRWVWAHADGRSESPQESVSRAVITWCGFETPVLQREFNYEGFHDRTDFYFPSTGVVGEADGWAKYDLADRATAAQRLADEKRREDRLRRHGHRVVRWEASDVWRVTPLRDRLLAAGVRPVRPASSAYLGTLRHRTRRSF